MIDAKRDYYGFDRVPEFWEWLVHHGHQQSIKIPVEVYQEFADQKDSDGNKDELAEWADRADVRDALRFAEEPDPDLVSRITYGGYVKNPSDDELVTIGRDPLLISYALRDTAGRCIVTSEVSKPSRQGANRHIPDVCTDFGIKCINGFQLFRELNFRTNLKP